MGHDLVIRGGDVVHADGVQRLDIAVDDGLVSELSPTISTSGKTEIDAHNLTVFPGVIDSHVHFNDPGRADWEGVETGSAALAAGGGTCFIDMPLNASPPTLDGPSFDAKLAALQGRSYTDFALYGGLTPDNLDRLEELAARGVVGFKAFLCPSGIDDFPFADDWTLFRGMERAAELGLPVLFHAENADITGQLTDNARRDGRRDARAFLESRPVIAELEAISRALLFAEETGCAVHVVHVSTARGVRMIRRALDERDVDASCETCPHYVTFTDADVAAIGPRLKCAPPLRSEDERRALLNELHGGQIDTVGSDHSPCPPNLKDTDDMLTAWGGVPGVQATLRALLTLDIDEQRIASVLAESPAGRFKLMHKGGIRIGRDADLTLVDPSTMSRLTREELRDRHRLSPYVGRTLRGAVRQVLLRGETICRAGPNGPELVGEPRGRLIRSTPRALLDNVR